MRFQRTRAYLRPKLKTLKYFISNYYYKLIIITNYDPGIKIDSKLSRIMEKSPKLYPNTYGQV